MPVILAWLAALVPIVKPLVIRVLTSLGLGVATYSGIALLLDQLRDLVVANINASGATILQYIAVFNVDRAITIIFSACTVRLVFMGMNASGAMTRMTWGNGGGGG
jgi:hypothetical protein